MQKVQLKDILYLQNGYAFKSNCFNQEKTGMPLIRISNIQENLVSLNDLVWIKNENVPNKDFYVSKGDLLIAMSGATTGKMGVYKGDMECLLNQRVGKFCIKENNEIHRDFVITVLLSGLIQEEIVASSAGGAQPNISSKTIEKISIPLPSLPEQKRIAEILSNIDYLIDILKLEISKFEKLKNANLEKFINESLEKGTKICALSKLVKLSQGLQVDLENQKSQKGLSKIRFIRIIDYTQNDIPRYVDKPEGEKGLVNSDDVVMVRYGASAGLVCRGIDGIIANNLFIVKPLGKLTKEYIFYFLSSNRMQNEIRKLALSSAMPALNFNSINSLKILVPPINQQLKISNLMNSFEDNIVFRRKKLEKVKSLKISISQDLLSGRKRVLN